MSYIDTRDLIEEANTLAGGDYENPDAETVKELDMEDTERLEALTSVLGEIGREARYGETLIPEDEFEGYARELAEDIGAIDPDASWPLSYINWSAAVDALRVDYSSVELDGTTYLHRS